MKPSIRKQDGYWVLTRPGYGFSPIPSESVFPSWTQAMDAAHPKPASAGPIVERGYVSLVPWGHYGAPRWAPIVGTIRMEETHD